MPCTLSRDVYCQIASLADLVLRQVNPEICQLLDISRG
jgi:hypothetical protein